MSNVENEGFDDDSDWGDGEDLDQELSYNVIRSNEPRLGEAQLDECWKVTVDIARLMRVIRDMQIGIGPSRRSIDELSNELHRQWSRYYTLTKILARLGLDIPTVPRVPDIGIDPIAAGVMGAAIIPFLAPSTEITLATRNAIQHN